MENNNTINSTNINKNSKEFLENHIQQLNSDFDHLYTRMNKRRKELEKSQNTNNLDNKTKNIN